MCNTENITQFIQERIHDVVLERETSSELVFGIKRGASEQIGQLINALDQQREDIAINGYGLSMATIEEVFLRSIFHSIHREKRTLILFFRLVEEEEEKAENYGNRTEETRRTLAKSGKYI
jgi:hypothetical protein